MGTWNPFTGEMEDDDDQDYRAPSAMGRNVGALEAIGITPENIRKQLVEGYDSLLYTVFKLDCLKHCFEIDGKYENSNNIRKLSNLTSDKKKLATEIELHRKTIERINQRNKEMSDLKDYLEKEYYGGGLRTKKIIYAKLEECYAQNNANPSEENAIRTNYLEQLYFYTPENISEVKRIIASLQEKIDNIDKELKWFPNDIKINTFSDNQTLFNEQGEKVARELKQYFSVHKETCPILTNILGNLSEKSKRNFDKEQLKNILSNIINDAIQSDTYITKEKELNSKQKYDTLFGHYNNPNKKYEDEGKNI